MRVAASYEWQWDICADPAELEPQWMRVPAFTGLSPSAPPQVFAGATYANGGSPRRVQTGEDVTVSALVRGTLDAGEFGAELLALIEAADARRPIGYRYYHSSSRSLAWGGTALVSWSRANVSNTEAEFFRIELVGQGDRVRIASPLP